MPRKLPPFVLSLIALAGAHSSILADTTPPDAAITTPAQGATVTTLWQISGTASDSVGLGQVRLVLERLTDGKFWDGKEWGGAETELPASLDTVSGQWQSSGQLAWLTAGGYTITAIVTDGAGNERRQESSFTAPRPTAQFDWFHLSSGALPGTALAGLNSIKSVSWDGSRLGGTTRETIDSVPYNRPARWTRGIGIEVLADLAGGSPTGGVNALSADGMIAAGFSSSAGSVMPDADTNRPSDVEAALWNASGVLGLGDITSRTGDNILHTRLMALSADGSVGAGVGHYPYNAIPETRPLAVRWTAESGLQEIGDFPGGLLRSEALGISGDGSIIVGYGVRADPETGNSQTRAFRWTAQTGLTGLPSEDFLRTTAYGISADGSTIVGYEFDTGYPEGGIPGFTHAVAWTPQGLVDLGDLPGGTDYSVAYAASGDGSIIVGESNGNGGNEAFIWDKQHGMQPLKSLLIRAYGLRTLQKWRLTKATAISADGYTIIGTGKDALGYDIQWVAVLPGTDLPPPLSGSMLTASAAVSPKIIFSETYTESLQPTTEYEDGVPSTVQDVVGKGSSSVTIVASMEGIDFSTADELTPIGFRLGEFAHEVVLGDDPAYGPGDTSVSFPITGLDTKGVEVKAGSIKYTWTSKALTITMTCTRPSDMPILYPQFLATAAQVDETIEASVQFGDHGGIRERVYVRGTASVTTKPMPGGADGEVFELSNIKLTASADYGLPTVAFTAPANNLRTTSSTVDISGKVTDAVSAPDSVQVRVNDGPFVDVETVPSTAATQATWSLSDVTLVPGPNVIEARALDPSGNASPTVSRTFTYVVMTTLTVSHDGIGSVTKGFEPESQREIGKPYTITATPGKDQVFAGWSGGLTSKKTALTFRMEESLDLAASFIANPFPAVAGDYKGLISTTGSSTLADNGGFSITITAAGSFTLKGSVEGIDFTLANKRFYSDGSTEEFIIARGKGKPPFKLTLQLDMDGGAGRITGELTDGTRTLDLAGQRPVIDDTISVPTGSYTLLFPNEAAELAGPNDGWAVLTISDKGTVTIAGKLIDGTLLSAATNISKDGEIPVFAKPVKGGAVFGLLQFIADAPSGVLHWIRPVSLAYPTGIDRDFNVAGAVFVPPPSGTRVLDGLAATNGSAQVTVSGGVIPAKPITISAANKVTVTTPGPDKLKVTILPATGSFSGTFVQPGSTAPRSFSGIFIQALDLGIGFYTTPSATGYITIEPAL